MAEDPTLFDRKSASRITNNVLWGEQQRQKGGDNTGYGHIKPHEVIYVQLIEKDPNGEQGFWSAQEVYYEDGRWELVDTERIWDGDAQPFIRHFSWGEAEIQQIVKLMLTIDVDTGIESWVFDTDVTNPEAFVFYSDQNGNAGQALKDSSWTMKTAGKVLTNVGEADILAPYTLTAGQSVQITVTFVDYGNGYQLGSAIMQPGEGAYWTETSGEITVNHRIATAKIDGDIVRLEQYHAGDVHLEVFKNSDEDTIFVPPQTSPLKIVGDEDWINVSRLGNLWTVNHKPPPGINFAKASMKGLDTSFSCDEVSFASFADVNTWVNDELLAKIAEIFYDTRGHIWKQTDCAGNPTYITDDPTSEYLASEMVANLVGSALSPDTIGGDGLEFTYKIKNQGANFLDYIGTKKIQVGLIMANGQAVQIAIDGAAPTAFNQAFFAENVDGTSGLRAIESEVPGELVCGVERFQFNSTAQLMISVIGIGLIQTETFDTTACALTATINDTIVRDRLDPEAKAMSLSWSADVAALGSAASPDLVGAVDNGPYLLDVSFEYGDGTPVAVSFDGATGPYRTTNKFLELDANSDTGTFDTVWFKLNDDSQEGDTIKMCATLRTWDRLTDANVQDCQFLDINFADECIIDGSGEAVSDGVDDCITDGSGPPVPALGLATCSHPGLGVISDTADIVSGYNKSGSGNDWAAVKAAMDSSSTTLVNSGMTVGYFNLTSSSLTKLQRRYTTLNTLGITSKIACKIVWSSNQTNRQFVVVYSTDSAPATTNIMYDMPSWTVLGSVINPTSSTETIEFDFDDLPRHAALRVGIMMVNDYEDDSTGMTEQISSNGYRLGSIIFYKCSS